MKKKETLCLLAFFFSLSSLVLSQTPFYSWVTSGGGPQDDLTYRMAVDKEGNSYVTGKFKSTGLDFGSGISISSVGNYDIFLAKYDTAGNVVWAKQAGSAGSSSADEGRGIALDANDNVVITGAFFGTAAFDTVSLTTHGNFDVFIAKYTSEGDLLWVQQGAGRKQDKGTCIAADYAGNYIVTGYFGGDAPEDTINFSGTVINGNGGREIFIVKLDPDGNVLWGVNAGGPSTGEEGWGIVTDMSNNIYVTGFFTGTSSFGQFELTSDGTKDIFVAKLDENGNFLWAEGIHGTETDLAYDIAVRPSVSEKEESDVYIIGGFKENAVADTIELVSNAASSDILIASYSSDGELNFVKGIGGPADDRGYSISVLPNGKFFASGSFQNTMQIDTATALQSAGDKDIFLFEMLGEDILWAGSAGGSDEDYSWGVHADTSENIHLAGYFRSSTAVFDSSEIQSSGGKDLYIAKIEKAEIPVSVGRDLAVIDDFGLRQNYPNPFNPATQIQFELPVNAYVKISVFNILGEEVIKIADRDFTAGIHEARFNTSTINRKLSSGIYFYKLYAKGIDGSLFTQSKKMILMR